MKKVSFSANTAFPEIKRPCLCQGCPYCKHRLNASNMYCYVFGKYRCEDCNEFRCEGCMYTKVTATCNYCKRIL